MTNPLDPAVEAQVDEILKSLVPDQIVSIGRPDGTAEHINQGERKRAAAKTAITRLLLRERMAAVKQISNKQRHKFQPIGGISNIEYIYAGEVDGLIATLEAQIKELEDL